MLKRNQLTSCTLRKAMILPALLAPVLLLSFTRPKAPAHTNANKSVTLVLDAAHGGTDAGSVGAGDVTEKALTLRMCRKMAQLAPEYKIDVVLTRDNDTYIPLTQRVQMANKIENGILVSLHVDQAYKDHTPANGYEVIVSAKNPQYTESKLLASAVAGGLRTAGIPARLSERRLHVLNNEHPAIGIECGNINDATDMALLQGDKELEATCRHILSGIAGYVHTTGK